MAMDCSNQGGFWLGGDLIGHAVDQQLYTALTTRTNLQVVQMPTSWSGMSVVARSWIGH